MNWTGPTKTQASVVIPLNSFDIQTTMHYNLSRISKYNI